jgi:predicted TIM-barrel fold metal-dependent hydrolase
MDAQVLRRANEVAHFGGHQVIDVDTHLSEPHDLWISRAPASIRHRVPQVKVHEGVRTWVIDGDRVIAYATSPTSVVLPDGSKTRGLEWLKFGLEDVHPASWRVKDRLDYMDGQGIAAQIVYPNVLGFGGQHASLVDPDLRLASTQIFNDAMAEMQAESGQRMFPMALMPWWDPQLTVKEAERCRAMGLRGVNINTDPQLHRGLSGDVLPDLGSPYWDPIWEACSALGLPINFHVGATSNNSAEWHGTQGWATLRGGLGGAVSSTMLYHQNARILGNLICAGIADRYPKIKFVSVESGIGWVPNLLETLDSREDPGPQAVRIFSDQLLRHLLVRTPQARRHHPGGRRRQRDVRDRLPAPDLPNAHRRCRRSDGRAYPRRKRQGSERERPACLQYKTEHQVNLLLRSHT